MKIKEGLYHCPWCKIDFQQTIGKTSGSGKKGVAVNQCICPKCNRYVSQKTKIEIRDRMEKGLAI